jgi:hypothetical protein
MGHYSHDPTRPEVENFLLTRPGPTRVCRDPTRPVSDTGSKCKKCGLFFLGVSHIQNIRDATHLPRPFSLASSQWCKICRISKMLDTRRKMSAKCRKISGKRGEMRDRPYILSVFILTLTPPLPPLSSSSYPHPQATIFFLHDLSKKLSL